MQPVVHTFAHLLRVHRWLAVMLAALSLAACQPVQPQSASAAPSTAVTVARGAIPHIDIRAQDFAFEMPDELPAGLVSITFTNEGHVNHHGYVMRLLDGVTPDQVMAAMSAEMEGTEGQATSEVNDLAFFLPDTDPGKSNQVTVELAPGNWLIVSFSMDPAAGEEMIPDWVKGSIQEFTVLAAEGDAPAAPAADIVVTIGADDFEMPTELAAGEQTIQIVNNSGEEDGYAFFVQLGGDTTVEDVLAVFEAMFSGQEPEEFPIISTVGGLMGYNLGESYYTTINFEPGNYAVISSIGSDEFPYAGLYKSFTVK